MSKTHRQIGNEGEDLACEFLVNKGWEILDRNYYSSHSEIDIIAKDNDFYVFVEVKSRSTDFFGRPEEYVNDEKVQRIFQAAEAWVIEKKLSGVPMRFDVIGILISKRKKASIHHLRDAFR
ncbi:MAG: YraN family protein [Balneolaceae bacterium]